MKKNQSLVKMRQFKKNLMSCWYAGICWGAEKPLTNFKGRADVHITDEDISLALQYWCRKGSREVRKFNKRQFIEKAAVEKNGILFCKSRIMDGQRFIATQAGSMKTTWAVRCS